MVPTARDLIKILGAVYQVERPRDAWFVGILQALAGTFHRGVGGVLYDLSCEPDLRVEAVDGIGIPPDWIQAGEAMHRDPRLVAGIKVGYRSCLCASLSDLTAIDTEGMQAARRDYYTPRNLSGQTMINGLDDSGKGCSVFVFSQANEPLSADAREVFSCLATHLTTAYRLNRRIMATDALAPGEVDAVLGPDGRIAHAETRAAGRPALQALTLAVREREGARRTTPTAPARALRAWKGLVSARWTLIDRYERDGRRYILARENAPGGRGPASLSTREQQVVALAALGRSNKLISYELGLAHSTVRVLVARACAKMAVSSRAELVLRLQASL